MTEEVFTGILNSFVTLSGVVDPIRCVMRHAKFDCHFSC